MEKPRVFKLPLSQGVQMIRLDEDSLDYDWKGSVNDFHGTLPYENLRMKMRLTRKDKKSGQAAVVVGLLFLALILIAPSSPWGRYVLVFGGVCLLNLVGYLTLRHIRRGSICVQIEPRPFGFSGELPVPDTRLGKAFLEELEIAWEASLRRRFLVRDSVNPSLQLQRINWLEFIGILTNEEAAAERSLVSLDDYPEPKLIESVN
jgi:hypothetical protein